MDLDGDGNRDVISGSWPGALYLFRGKADGTFAKATKLEDKDGEDIVVGSASVPYAVDWEGDGDLDLVVGNIDGDVNLLLNESNGKALKWGAAKKLMADAQVIRVPGGDSGPVVADWDGDGRHDLLLGCGDGSVRFYKNMMPSGEPLLRGGDVLVPASKSYMANRGKEDGAASPCGSRAKIATADFNADGTLDLLLGDFSMGKAEQSDLTDEQEARRDQLQAEIDKLNKTAPAIYLPVYNKVLVEMGYAPIKMEKDKDGNLQFPRKLPVPDDKMQDFGEKAMKAVQADEAASALQEKMAALYQELGPLQGQSHSPHGHVWVFLRKP